MRAKRVLAVFLLGCAAGCAPTVQVTAPEPIVINLNIQHEVRVKVEREVDDLLDAEQAPAVMGRGIDDDARLPPADAEALARAKAAGELGERADGYLGAHGEVSDETRDLLERINALRRAEYGEIAQGIGAERLSVETIAGERRLAAARPGELVMDADGRWRTAQ